MRYVFDASFVGAQIIPNEKDQQVENLYNAIKYDDEKYAPQLLWYEIANIFYNLCRRKRYFFDEIERFFPLLADMRLQCDAETGSEYSRRLLRLCHEYDLSSYDAAYLELAERKKAVLCSLDKGLRAAAKKHGIPLIRV